MNTPPVATFDRQDEARNLCDWLMAEQGYHPCRDEFQLNGVSALDKGAVVRLYTMDIRGGTNHGGVSVGLSKSELAKDTWSNYVKFQIETVLQRKIR